jgi:hypothetical protein
MNRPIKSISLWVDEYRTGSGSDPVLRSIGLKATESEQFSLSAFDLEILYRKCDPVATASGSVFIDPRQAE